MIVLKSADSASDSPSLSLLGQKRQEFEITRLRERISENVFRLSVLARIRKQGFLILHSTRSNVGSASLRLSDQTIAAVQKLLRLQRARLAEIQVIDGPVF